MPPANGQAGAARVVLVGVDFGNGQHFDPTLDELALLAESAGDVPVERVIARRKAPDPALFVGSGKADEIKLLVQMHGAECVIFDQALSPAQQRNLERTLGVAVADRTALILEIFAQRAQSHEGKLQVELARLQYLGSRLVRRWSHLERQTGGAGQRGGPGEAQIELDKRMIAERVKSLKGRLVKVKRQRDTQRHARRNSGSFRISLVGYTNAGKSTLFNALVKARAYAADQLFATLDTTTRSLYLEALGGTVSLSDTVGFIRDLPHSLVASFRSTLDAALDAALVLHIVDAGDPSWRLQEGVTAEVLSDIGAEELPRVLVFNKIDKLSPEALAELRAERPEAWFTAAHVAEEVEGLHQRIARHFLRDAVEATLLVPWTAGALLAKLRGELELLSETHEANGTRLRVRGERPTIKRWKAALKAPAGAGGRPAGR